eukprot:4101761-Amphidinium_carterae.1
MEQVKHIRSLARLGQRKVQHHNRVVGQNRKDMVVRLDAAMFLLLLWGVLPRAKSCASQGPYGTLALSFGLTQATLHVMGHSASCNC